MKGQEDTHEQAKAYYSLVIENTAAKVWDTIRDFHDTRWMGETFNYKIVPDRESDKVGSVRVLSSEKGEITEHLLTHSDDDRFYTYNYSGAVPDGVNDFQASIRIIPTEESDNAYAEWTAVFSCSGSDRATLEKYYVDNISKALKSLNEYLLKVKK